MNVTRSVKATLTQGAEAVDACAEYTHYQTEYQGMRDCASYLNCHAGEDIYVLTSGKSLDHYDKSVFDGRVTIGVNQVPELVKCTYGMRKEISEPLLEQLAQLPGPQTLFLSVGSYGNDNRINQKRMQQLEGKGTLKQGRVVLYEHAPNTLKLVGPLPRSDNHLVVSHSTITTAVHLAAHMGAKAIYIVGHDCGTLDGHLNCDGYHTTETLFNWHKDPAVQSSRYKAWLGSIEEDTVRLKGLLKAKYGCHVVSLSPFVGLAMEGHIHER